MKTVLFGLDGATYTVLDSLMDQGVMPNLREFCRTGVRANLTSTPLPITPQVGMQRASEESRLGQGVLLDVRGQSEWNMGHAPNALHIPLGYLAGRADEVPSDRPVFVHCGGGTRSAIATSVLHRAGLTNVANIPGGFYEYKELGLPIEKEAESAPVG